MGKHSLGLARAGWRLALAIVIALVVAGCGPGNTATTDSSVAVQNAANTAVPTSQQPTNSATWQPVRPTPTLTITPVPLAPAPTPVPQVITIETPTVGTSVGSPMVITGHTTRLPKNSMLNYRVVDGAGQQLGGASFPVSGAPGQPGVFNASLTFNLPWDGGPVRVEIFELGDAAGAVAASNAIDVVVEAQHQGITIDTPPAGTVVGSPMVLTGQALRAPHGDNLNYRVLNSAGQQIGAGTFPASGVPGAARRFNAELFFDLPINGDAIRVELYDWNADNGTADASAVLGLTVAPVPQQIIIDTPPAGTLVGSPMVITGRTTRFPFQGDLAYRITNDAGQQLGASMFQVIGQVDQPTSFNASLTFNVARDGGAIHLDVFDQNPADGTVVASSRLDLDVLAQYQAIAFETPASGTTVGSPVVITGRTNLYPNRGQLSYRVTDAGGKQIGTGSFPADGAPGQRTRFNASLDFTEPPNGGNIRLEVFDQADNGTTITSAPIDLVVAAPSPQQIIIETPPAGTQVGSPVVITGRTTRPPANGQLNYRFRDAAGKVIGAGAFPVSSTTGRATSFNASLSFAEPHGGGTITVEIYDQNGATGALIASASISMYVAPQP